MTDLNFFYPISYSGSFSTINEKFIEYVDDYLYLGGKQAVVIKKEGGITNVKLVDSSINPFIKALKIASYIIVILPLCALVLKSFLRLTHKFHVVDLTESQQMVIEKINLLKPSQQTPFDGFSLEEKRSIDRAIKIQKVWRGHQVRISQKLPTSSLHHYTLYERGRVYLNSLDKLVDEPRASSGKTPVFLPKGQLFVLKKSGAASGSRLQCMRIVRQFCQKNNLSHLTIPQAFTYHGYLIEARLPLIDSLRPNIIFYYENTELFNNAVTEFTTFLSLNSLRDIIGEVLYLETPLMLGRYDNVAPYVTKDGIVKLGLIDLERWEEEPSSCFIAGYTAIVFFPYHFNLILNILKKHYPETEVTSHLREFSEIQRKTQDSFKKLFINHTDFLKKNEVNLAHPFQPLPLSVDRLKEVAEILSENFKNDLWKAYSCTGRGKSQEIIMEYFKNVIVPRFIEILYCELEKLAKRALPASYAAKNYIELAMLREIQIDLNRSDFNDFTDMSFRKTVSKALLHILKPLAIKEAIVKEVRRQKIYNADKTFTYKWITKIRQETKQREMFICRVMNDLLENLSGHEIHLFARYAHTIKF